MSDHLASAIFTQAAQHQAQALAKHEVLGSSLILDLVKDRDLEQLHKMYDWMLANGWTGGEEPDYEALLLEE